MPIVSTRRRLPRGFVYRDTSSKGGTRHHCIWCAEIYFANVRIRKRGADKKELEKWLSVAAETIHRRMMALPEDARPEVIAAEMQNIKNSLRTQTVSERKP